MRQLERLGKARTFEEMCAEAWERLRAIRANDEEPSECHFLVTPMELCTLVDRTPFIRPEMDMSRTRFFGMSIAVRRC